MHDDKSKTYTIALYDRHIAYLDKINRDNRSGALQTILDSIINGQEQVQRKQRLDNNLQFICYGFILFFISYLMSPFIQLISVACGAGLLSYGLLGEIRYALSRTNNRR